MSNCCCCDSGTGNQKDDFTRILRSLLSVNEFIYGKNKKITPTEMWVLTLLIYEWEKQHYFPIVRKIDFSKKLDLGTRQIQRTFLNLEMKRYISRVLKFESREKFGDAYDITGILDLLEEVDRHSAKMLRVA